MRLILALVLSQGAHPVRADIADVGHYSQALVDSILDIYVGNGSSSSRRSDSVDPDDSKEDFETTLIVPTYIYPYLLLALWVACIGRCRIEDPTL